MVPVTPSSSLSKKSCGSGCVVLVDIIMIGLGYATLKEKFRHLKDRLNQLVGSGGEHKTWAFDLDGIIHMFDSYRKIHYWPLLEHPPKGIEIVIVYAEDDDSELVFMGKEKRNFLMKRLMWLVDDFDAWNAFPWGEYMWEKFCNETVNVIWILERYPNSQKWWSKKANVIPRGFAWSKVAMFGKSDYEELFRPMSNPNVALILSPKETSHAWFKASAEFIKELDDQDGTFFQDDQGREKCIKQHNEMCGDTKDDDMDGILDSQTKDVIEEAEMLPTMSSNSPQAGNATVSEFFAEFDALKKKASSSSAHPKNDKDVSHLDDNMEIDGQNEKDGFSNSHHHLHLLIKALGTKIKNPSIDVVVPSSKVDDPMLRTIKPKDDFDEANVDSYDDDYMSLFNDEEQPVKSSLNDLELQQESDKVDGPNLERGLGTLKFKKKNCQCALRPNYLLRSAQIRKKKMDMSLKSPFGQQSDTTLVPTKRKTRLKKTYDIVLPFDLEDISGQLRIRSINHIMTHDPFVKNQSRPDDCKSDKVTVPEYMSAFITNKDLPEYLFPWGKLDIIIDYFSNSHMYPLPRIAVEKEYFLVNEPKEHWCLAELKILTGVVTFYDSLGWAGGSRRHWWRRMKKVLPEKLTLYLLMHGIFDSKGISADEYKITYNYAYVPF
nr:phospholipase-like protein [Tanacetum cinerariifolium]